MLHALRQLTWTSGTSRDVDSDATTSRLHTLQIVYYDGQFNDARLNVALACTAALAGATVLNHARVTKLIKVRCSHPLKTTHQCISYRACLQTTTRAHDCEQMRVRCKQAKRPAGDPDSCLSVQRCSAS